MRSTTGSVISRISDLARVTSSSPLTLSCSNGECSNCECSNGECSNDECSNGECSTAGAPNSRFGSIAEALSKKLLSSWGVKGLQSPGEESTARAANLSHSSGELPAKLSVHSIVEAEL